MSGPEIVALVLGAAVGAFVLAELVARSRIRHRAEYFVLAPYHRAELEVDRETLPSLEPRVRIEVNRDGERGDPTPRDWRETYRVLVAGGSAAECYLLDQETQWPAVVQRVLNEPENARRLGARRVHVGNVSRSLVACEYISEILRRVLPRYPRLDLVVLMVGASDMVAWLEKKTPEAIEPGRLSDSYVFAEHPNTRFRWTLGGLALRRLLARWNRRLRRPVERRSGAGKTIAKNRRMRAAAREIVEEVPDPAPMLAYFETFFRELLRQARAKGARVLVVRQPCFDKQHTPEEQAVLWNFGVGRPYEEEVTVYYAHSVVAELMRRIDQVAVRVSEQEGVEHLDLMPLLERSLATYYDYLHFTPRGARAVGEAVAEAVLARALDRVPHTARGRAEPSQHDVP